MKELVCITCPMGCHLTIRSAAEALAESAAQPSGELVITGNRCPRGVAYAKEELLDPKRTVTATCRLVRDCAGPACSDSISPARSPGAIPGGRAGDSLSGPRRVSCRTTAAFPRHKVDELLGMIYATEVALPVARGQIIIANALGTGIDVIATRAIG